MKLSFIISILDSHQVVKHYVEHLRRMHLPDDVQVIFMDDGSNPPLHTVVDPFPKLDILETGNSGLWTGGLARNLAAKEVAIGDYLLMTDIDHIITHDAIQACRNFDGDKMVFFRYCGYFDESSNVVCDADSLLAWGVHPSLVQRKMCCGVHTNTFCIRRQVFLDLGCYNEQRCNMQDHRMGEDREFNRRWSRAASRGVYKNQETGPNIYFYATGRFRADGAENPYGLFHGQPHHHWGDP